MKKVEYFVLEHFDFDSLVNEHIKEVNGKYEFVTVEEASNYTCFTYDDCKAFDDCECSLNFKNLYGYQAIELLIKKGILEPGNYLIRVFW